MQRQRITGRQQDHSDNHAWDHPSELYESIDDAQDTDDSVQPSGKSVCEIPVVLVSQRPGKLDPHGIILVTLGQVVPDHKEEDAHQQIHEECRVQPAAHWERQGVPVDGGGADDGNHRTEHQEQAVHLLADILVLRVDRGAEGA